MADTVAPPADRAAERGHRAAKRYIYAWGAGRAEGNAGIKMMWYVVRAHAALLANAGRLWRQRREIRSRARITPRIFRHLVLSHSISARRVAGL